MQTFKDQFTRAAVVLTAMLTLAVHAQSTQCNTYTGTDIGPIPASGTAGAATFRLNVIDDVLIRDVNIVDLKGKHTWMGDLDFYLTSPGGTVVHFRQQACFSDDNFNFRIDDEAPPGHPPCPPTDGRAYQSTGNGDGIASNVPDSNLKSTLSAFENERSAGTWTLTIVDRLDDDDGQLDQWALEICGVGSDANILFDQPFYSCNRLISVKIVDANAQAESIELVVSTDAGDSEMFVAVDPESDNVYTASISTGEVTDFPLPGDGKIQGFQVDTITATYFDDADSFGNPATIVNATKFDCEPPSVPSAISDPQIGETTLDSTVTLVWNPGDDGDGSGIAGYSWVVDRQAGTEPDDIPEPSGLPNEIPIGLLGVGSYWLHIHAVDVAGNKSQTLHIGPWIIFGGPDGFEDDDSPENATSPFFQEGAIHQHNFHDSGDEDWVKILDSDTSLKIFDMGVNNNLILEIYENVGTSQVPEQGNFIDRLTPNSDGNIIITDRSLISFTLLRIRHSNSNIFGAGTDYKMVFEMIEGDPIFSGDFTFSPPDSAPANAFLIITNPTTTISSDPDPPSSGIPDLDIEIVEPIVKLSTPYQYLRTIGEGTFQFVARAPNFRPISVSDVGIFGEGPINLIINFQFQANPMTYTDINGVIPIFNEVAVNDLGETSMLDTGTLCVDIIDNRRIGDNVSVISGDPAAPQISVEGSVVKFDNTPIGNLNFNSDRCPQGLAIDFIGTNVTPAQAIVPLMRSIGFQTSNTARDVRRIQATLELPPFLIYSTTRDIVTTSPYLDVDGDGEANVFVDGIIIVRFMFNIRGDDLISGVIDPIRCSRCTADEIEAYLELAESVGVFDVDQSGGAPVAFVDGVSIVRFLAGIRGAGLSQTDPEGIVAFLTRFLP